MLKLNCIDEYLSSVMALNCAAHVIQIYNFIQFKTIKFQKFRYITYAIEVRADDLYPVYQDILSANNKKVTVKSIILEEEGHLEEMITQLKSTWPDWEQHAAVAVQIESELFQDWVNSLLEVAA